MTDCRNVLVDILACFALCWLCGCNSHALRKIAVIPQTEGVLVWEAAHVGAEEAVQRRNAFVYWNAPTREDDVEAQISIIERITEEGFQGLVLAPDQALALVTPVRRVLSRAIPTVIISSPIAVPAGKNLFYILNDDEAGGRIAAQRVAGILRGSGRIAILGIDPDLAGIITRTRAFETFLAENYPRIRIVEKRLGSFNVPHEHQVAQEIMNFHPDLDMIVAMMGSSIEGTLSAVKTSNPDHRVRVIGFNSYNWPLFDDNPDLDSVIQEDTRSMGKKAVELILDKLDGKPVPARTTIPPTVISRDNVDSAQVQEMWSQDWTLGRIHWSQIQ
jgi:ribose transport system substrate-binding protein